MKYDNAQLLFTTCDVEGCVIGISNWYEVDSSTSNTYDSQYSVLAVGLLVWCKCASYIGSDIVNFSVTCLMISSDGGGETSFNACSTVGS